MTENKNVKVEDVKKLRGESGAGVMDCKKALSDAGSDFDKALGLLREKGLSLAAKKASRATHEGLIFSYIHFGGKIGVLLELNCETDFVAKTEEFKQLAKDISMHIAWSNPSFVSREDIPEEEFKNVTDKEKFFVQTCLLEQPFLKENDLTVNDHLIATIAKIGENIKIKRFIRYQLGEDNTK